MDRGVMYGMMDRSGVVDGGVTNPEVSLLSVWLLVTWRRLVDHLHLHLQLIGSSHYYSDQGEQRDEELRINFFDLTPSVIILMLEDVKYAPCCPTVITSPSCWCPGVLLLSDHLSVQSQFISDEEGATVEGCRLSSRAADLAPTTRSALLSEQQTWLLPHALLCSQSSRLGSYYAV